MKKSSDKLMAMSALLLLPVAVYASVPPVVSAPEPSTWSLFGLGAVAAVIVSRFKKNK